MACMNTAFSRLLCFARFGARVVLRLALSPADDDHPRPRLLSLLVRLTVAMLAGTELLFPVALFLLHCCLLRARLLRSRCCTMDHMSFFFRPADFRSCVGATVHFWCRVMMTAVGVLAADPSEN